jgi:hypothetical protein
MIILLNLIKIIENKNKKMLFLTINYSQKIYIKTIIEKIRFLWKLSIDQYAIT